MTSGLIRTDYRYGGRPRAFALLAADSLPAEFGLDEAGVEREPAQRRSELRHYSRAPVLPVLACAGA